MDFFWIFFGFFLEFLRIFRDFLGGILWEFLGNLWFGDSDLEFFCEFCQNSVRILCEFLGDVWLGGSECMGVDFG